ncbi:MAG: fumarate hydratase C-terminal domain-containing protein [Desulfovibrio sp.]|nr:fumarate hydratase C-terminal domain-containing protein [Desulfovibrio sp.]MBI4958540.1 fumarate hydratase C-terminal domain-containing protein [Desulfovibrio sp.]
MRPHRLITPLARTDVRNLRAGDVVYLTGTVYAAREQAHMRLLDDLDKGLPPPFDLQGAVIYYVGPSPMTPDRPIGAAGPSSASRMDPFAERLHSLGVLGTIGKGRRSPAVRQALIDHKAIYLGATGGAGALLSLRIRQATPIAYLDLGPEAVHMLVVEDFPLVVLYDSQGGDLHANADLNAALSS